MTRNRLARPRRPAAVLLASAVCLAGAGSAGVEAAAPLTIDGAIEMALAQNPGLLEVRERVEELRAQRRATLGRALTQVNAEASTARDRDPGLLNSPNFGSLADAPGFDPSFLVPIPVTTYEYRLTVDQAIYSFGKVPAGLRALDLQKERSAQAALALALDIARDTAIACLDVAFADERVLVLETEKRSREQQVERARDFLEIGAGTRLQLLQAEAGLASVRPRRIEAEGDGREARARLNRLLGRPALEPVAFEASVLDTGSLPELPPVGELIAGIDRRPELVAIELELRELGEQRKVIRADRLPSFRFSGWYGFRAIETDNLSDTDFATWSAGIYASVPVWDGGERKHQVLQLASQARQAEHRRRARRAELAEQLVRAIASYDSARESAEAARHAVEQSEEAQRVAQEEYRFGAATVLEMLEAERTLTEARLQLLGASRDARDALYRVTTLTGRWPGSPLQEGDTP